MEYRALSENGLMQASQDTALPKKARQNRISGVSQPSTAGSTEKFRAGSTVLIKRNFQDFLAEQTAAVATGQAKGTPSSSDSHEPSTVQQKRSTVSVAGLHVVQEGETIWELAREGYQVNDCSQQEVVAGWYGKFHQGRPMANGQRFDMHGATIAHRDMPIGTKVELENPVTGEKATAVVADRGPFLPGRDVDLSYSLAKRLSLAKQGVGTLKMRVL